MFANLILVAFFGIAVYKKVTLLSFALKKGDSDQVKVNLLFLALIFLVGIALLIIDNLLT